MDNQFRCLPGVDKLLSEERIKRLERSCPRELLAEIVRQYLDEVREAIAAGNSCPPLREIVKQISSRVDSLLRPSLRPVINATGVILHTNLGRAALSKEAVAAMKAVAVSYCNLEFDLESGRRGSRDSHAEGLLCQLTGAEAALVVNNNAAAVLLALTALAKRKEVIVSRGQAVEIGGGFRIPDVMRQSGAKLVEVGTTNCTYLKDYEEAITPRTAALMRIHSSNFRLVGFTQLVGLEELVSLGKPHEIPVIDDLGSGCFLEVSRFGLEPEPLVSQSVQTGASLALFSGDKLLGGPQAGIIVGQKRYVDRLKKHPLYRATRLDKIRLAGLLATLVHYAKGEAETKVPIWRLIATPLDDLKRRAGQWAAALGKPATVIAGETMIGGGSLPGSELPTWLVAVGAGGKRGASATAQALSQYLRRQRVPIIGRISDRVFLLDPRSVLPEEDAVVIRALRGAAATIISRDDAKKG